MTTEEAFDKVVEELILNFLGDLQKDQLSNPSNSVLPAAAVPVATH